MADKLIGLAHATLNVQDYHVGIQLAPEQELAEATAQHHQPPIPLRRRHAA